VGFADTNLRVLRYSPESSYAETPSAPAMTVLRSTGDTFAYNKKQDSSKEIRQDRMVPSIAELGVTTEGMLNIELSIGGTYDKLLEAVVCGTWVDVALTGLTLTTVASAKTVTRSAGDWVTDGIVKGGYVKFGGTGILAGNVGPFKVASLTSTVLTLLDPAATLADDSARAAQTAKMSYLRNGVTKRSFLIEKEFTDIATSFQTFLGMRAVEMALNLKAESFIDGSFTFWGKTGSPGSATVKGSEVATTTTPVLSASANVATVQYQGANLTSGIKDLAMKLSDSPRHRPIVGSKFDADIGLGQFDIDLTGTALVDNLTLFTAVVNHTTVEFDLPIFDELGNYLYMSLPALKLTGNPDTPSGNQDVDFKLTAKAFRDAATNCMIQFDRVQAPA
jgi:hypothetical protein